MKCSVKENLDKILDKTLGIKEGQQVPLDLQSTVEAKINAIQDQMTLYGFYKPIGSIQDGVLKYNHDNLSELEDAIDNYEEEYSKDFDSQFDDYIDNHFDDINFETIEPGENEVNDDPHEIYVGNSPLYAPIIQPVTSNPVNLLEWKEQREAVLAELKKKHASYLKEGYQKNKEKVTQINRVIQELELELKTIDTKDPKNIFKSLAREINSINDILDSVSVDPVQASILYETSNLIKRLEDLNMFFMGSNLLGDVYDVMDSSSNAKTYRNFKDGLDEKDYLDVVDAIKTVTNKYHTSTNKIIVGIIQSNDLVKEHLKNNKNWSEKTYDLKQTSLGYEIVESPAGKPILELLEQYVDMSLPLDVNALSSFYGAGTGGGILGSILHIVKEANLLSEQGLTNELSQRMSTNWQKIMHEKDSQGNPLSDYLFRKDINGVRSPYLESAYSDSYFDSLSMIRDAKHSFYKDIANETKYGIWMATEKNNTTKLDPRKLSIIKNAFNLHPDFKGAFADDSIIASYEQELRDYLGDTMYEIEMKKALEKFTNYASQADEGFTAWQKHNLNPIKFMEHYESADFRKKDPTTASFLLPDYVHSIPNIKNRSLLNKDFYDNIESHSGLSNTWKDMYSALEYINPFLKSQGINVSALELPQYEDMLDNEALKDLSWFGKISAKLKNILINFRRNFYDSYFDKDAFNDEEQGTGEINVFYTSSPKNRKRKMADALSQLSEKELFDIAKKEGVKVQVKFLPTDNAVSKNRKIRKIANSIAQNRINKTTSRNSYENIKNMLDVVNNARARENTLGIYNTFLNFAKKKAYGKTSQLYDYLDSWGQLNIIKNKYAQSGKLFGIGEKFITNMKMPSKLLHVNEKDVIEMLQKLLPPKQGPDRRNLRDLNVGSTENPLYLSGSLSNFTTSNVEPYKRNSSHKGTPIDNDQAEALIQKYVENEIDKLGTTMTIGSVLQGLGSNAAKKVLQFNFISGITNRTVGHLANLKLAASGRYGFNEKGLNKARSFLLFSNTLKYADRLSSNPKYKDLINKKMFKKAKDIETFKMFAEQLGLINNRADELALANKFGNSKFDKLGLRYKDFTVDANINNPEWHNQGEVILAVLYDTMVKNKKGEEKRFFDGHTTIYKPGTLELKEEFDTPENRRMWVEFKNEHGADNTHAAVIAKFKRARDAAQGNYDNNDIVPFHGSLTGKLSSMFMRYLPENMFHQWGKKKVDFRTGEINYKGSKLLLVEHVPTFAMYSGMMGTGRLVAAGTSIAMFAVPVIGWGALGSVIAGAGIMYMMRKTLFKREQYSREELKLAYDFFKEVVRRSGGTVLSTVTGGKYTIDPKQGIDYTKGNLTKEERDILSESAQEVANKFNTYFTHFMVAAILKGMWLLTRLDADDDEEEILFKLKELDGVMNKMTNIRENINGDIERSINPYQFGDSFSSTIFGKQVFDWLDATIKTSKDVFYEGKKDGGDLIHQILKNPLSPTPNNITRALFTDDGLGTFIEDKKVWQDMDRDKAIPKTYFADDFIKQTGKSDETIQNELVDKKKRRLRTRVKDEITRTLRKEKGLDGLDLEKETKKLTDEFMKKYAKPRNTTAKPDFDFREELDRLDEYTQSIK